jgi:crossover junction endodeoxyribonuclease RuvC
MIILAVDQGLASFGWAVLNCDKQIELIDYGCFTTNAQGNQQERIFKLLSRFENLIDTYSPGCLVHERLFFSPPGKNVRKKSASILNTNMITGAMWYLAGKHNIPVEQYSPQTVKKSLTGNGRAEKDVMIKEIESRFSIECIKTHKEHICDAISIGLAYIKNNNIVKDNT